MRLGDTDKTVSPNPPPKKNKTKQVAPSRKGIDIFHNVVC